jgi:hypothetical protein
MLLTSKVHHLCKTHFKPTMYQLQINFLKESEWKDTVYQPMELNRVQSLLKQYQSVWGNTHDYRIIPTN